MLNCYAPEVPPDSKRRKKTKEKETYPSLSGLSLLPDEIALRCVARVSRFDHAALSVVSKSHQSLVTSPELFFLRCKMGCFDASLYVCIQIFRDLHPRWFILTPNRRLNPLPIPLNPYQAPHSSSFVVVNGGIYVIGGLINGHRTSDVSYLDCYSHTWYRFPPMNMPRASASVSLVDGKIYVFGGFGHYANYSTWAEVYDPENKTWDPLLFLHQIWDIETPQNKDIHQSVVIGGRKIFAVDKEDQSLYILPRECILSINEKRDCKLGYGNDWCIIGKLLYCRGTRGRILWCEPDELDWKEMKGLDELQHSISSSRRSFNINKLCINSAGNIVIFWNAQSLDLWSAEISVERREGDEIWGKIEWSGVVFEVDPSSHSSYGVKVLYSASVYV